MTRKQGDDRIIKKYPNRRLYDTQTSAYITLLDVKQLVLEQALFKVVDAKSGEDLTRSILLQIILEEEGGGMPMFSSPMLSQMIRFYGHAMQGMMGSYLEKNMQTFIDMQSAFAEQMKVGGEGGVGANPLNPEHWAQFLSPQAPLVQNAMNGYIEQSRELFAQMQARLSEQSQGLFGAFPYAPAKSTRQSEDKS